MWQKKYAGHCLSKSNNRGAECQNTGETSSPPKWVQSADLLGRDNLKKENAVLNSKFKYTDTLQFTLKWNAHLKRAYSLIKVQLWSVGMKVIRRNRASSRLQGQMMEGIVSWKREKNSLKHRKQHKDKAEDRATRWKEGIPQTHLNLKSGSPVFSFMYIRKCRSSHGVYTCSWLPSVGLKPGLVNTSH